MKKKNVSLAVGLLLLAMTVTGCGKGAAGTAETKKAAQEETTGTTQTVQKATEKATQSEQKEAVETTGAVVKEAEETTQTRTPEHVPVILKTNRTDIFNEEVGASEAEEQYVEILLDEETEKKYPEMAEALKRYNAEEAAAAKETLEGLCRDYDDMKETGALAYQELVMSDLCEGTVLRADSNVISVFREHSSYWGGVHGMYAYSGVSFDTASGRELTIADVVADMDAFFGLVNDKMKSQYADIYEYLSDVEEYLAGIDPADNQAIAWSIDSEGVNVYFNPYTLGAYAMGAQIISVGFDEAPEIFEERYMMVPETYVIPMNQNIPRCVDTDGDGERELVEIMYEPVEYAGEYSGQYDWQITAGDRSVTVPDSCYSENSYLVRANDQYYLYIFECSDNDYRLLATVDFKNMVYDQDKTINAGTGMIAYDWRETEDGYASWDMGYGFTDPENFELETRLDMLSTITGKRAYHVGRDGYPVSNDEWYQINGGIVLQSKQDVVCDQVDKNGRKTAETTLGKNTYVILVRTDGETWVDVQEIDESEIVTEEYGEEYGDLCMMYVEDAKPDYDRAIYRISVNCMEYPHTVNGIEEDQMFSGIMYAG